MRIFKTFSKTTLLALALISALPYDFQKELARLGSGEIIKKIEIKGIRYTHVHVGVIKTNFLILKKLLFGKPAF